MGCAGVMSGLRVSPVGAVGGAHASSMYLVSLPPSFLLFLSPGPRQALAEWMGFRLGCVPFHAAFTGSHFLCTSFRWASVFQMSVEFSPAKAPLYLLHFRGFMSFYFFIYYF